MLLSGVFLALALTPRDGDEPAVLPRLLPGLALACLAGILAVTVVYQYQFLPRAVPLLADDRDPAWRPVRGHPHDTLTGHLPAAAAASTSPARRRRRTGCSFFYQVPAFYLFWPHRIATNSVWMTSTKGLDVNDDPGPLPPATLAYYETREDGARRGRAGDRYGRPQPRELERSTVAGSAIDWSWSGRSTRSSAGPACAARGDGS